MTNHISIFLLLGCALSFPVYADETVASCLEEWKQATNGSPDNNEKRQAYQECIAKAEEQKKGSDAATRFTWAGSLDALPGGGWQMLQVSPDGTFAAFGSRRHESRRGSVVAVWLRFENRNGRQVNGITVKSEVERTLYDCERMTTKSISAAFYSENNLHGDGPSETYDESKVTWTPVIPGSVGDELLDWACRSAVVAKPPKAQAEKR